MPVRNVIVLNDFCHVQGGASRVAIDEAVALRAYGLNVTFLGAVGPVCDALRDARVNTICLDQPELADVAQHPGVALRAMWNQTAYRTTRQVLAEHHPRETVVHLHGYTKALTTTPALAANRARFPTLCTLHDFFAACPNGAFFDYRAVAPCLRVALSADCAFTNCDKRHPAHKAFRVARAAAQRHLGRFPASVHDYITLSDRSARLLRPYLPRDARFYPLDNIIDVPHAPPVDVAANRPFLVVGRLDAEKGALLAAEAAQRSGRAITFVGDGPLRAAVEACGAQVTGWLATDAVRAALDRARCLVFPSLWYETFGLVVSEAAARGVPAIVSDVTAAAERVKHGQNGWVFRSGDIDALIDCIANVADDAVVRDAGAAAYRRYWNAPSDPQRHAAALIAIYEAVSGRAAAAKERIAAATRRLA